MKNSLLLLTALVLIGATSCSRLYSSRSYVKSDQQAVNRQENRKSDRQESPETITAKKSESALITDKAAPEAQVIPFTVKQKEQLTVASKANKETAQVEAAVEPEIQAPAQAEQGKQAPVASVPNKKTDGGKSQLVALILCALVGTLGIHRFYLGYTGIGIIQLLTLGVCGIWTLIDLIMIITGDLKPKNGEYAKTFDDF